MNITPIVLVNVNTQCSLKVLQIRAIVYIDDGIVASKSQEQCLMDEQLVTSDLDLAGLS